MPRSPMATVELCGISKTFAGAVRPAVAPTDLRIGDGALLVLVGPSGCGKSTLLRMIAGLEEPTAGRVLIDGRDVTRVAPRDRDMAMVFQSYALYPHMTVAENLAFGLKMRGVRRAERDRRVAACAAELGLAELVSRRPRELSGGQQQRVALGRAIIREPKVFLLDEPLSNLDAKLRAEVRVSLKRLHAKLGATMVYVTHDQVEAMTLGGRIAILDRGVVQQVDAPLVLYDRPANRFVAGFLGTPPMNFLRLGGREIGVRPVDVILGDGVASLTAAVEVVEPLGDAKLVYLALADGQPLVARADARLAVEPGSRRTIAFREGRIHSFDPSTGRRVASGSEPEPEPEPVPERKNLKLEAVA